MRGLGQEHLDDGVLRIARAVLRLNCDIAYAGDLRSGGFATALSDDSGTVVLGPRFVSFMGWPFHGTLTPARIADTLGLCRYVRIPPVGDVAGIEPFSKILPLDGRWLKRRQPRVKSYSPRKLARTSTAVSLVHAWHRSWWREKPRNFSASCPVSPRRRCWRSNPGSQCM